MKFILIGFLISITSCNFNKHDIQEDTFTIDGKWILHKVSDSIFDINQIAEGEIEFQPYLIFDTNQNKIGGYSGCNTFITNASFENSQIQILNNITATERVCYKNWESDFFKMVEGLDNYKISYDTLYLNVKNNKKIVFLKADKFGINGSWKLTKINGKPIDKNSKLPSNLKSSIIAIDTDKDLIYGTTGTSNFESFITFTPTSWHQNSNSLNKKAVCKTKTEKDIYNTLLAVSEYTVENDILVLKSAENTNLEFSKLF